MNAVDEADLDSVLDALGFDGTSAVDPFGPAGVGTFVLDLENGYKVKQRWPFDLEKFRSGNEHRIARNSAPQESYDGAAKLIGNQMRVTRATLARYAAQGTQFLFGLPHESIGVTAVSGEVVTCTDVALCDWTRPGQRGVAVYYDDEGQTVAIDVTIQDIAGDQITLDIAPHAETVLLMPTRPVYFDPQQTFARYPVNAEVWQVTALAAIFDFVPGRASVALEKVGFPATNAIAYTRQFGAVGDLDRIKLLFAEGAGPTGSLDETGPVTTFFVDPGVTTWGALGTALDESANFVLGGTYNPVATIDFEFDGFASGAEVAGSIGTGATLTEYADYPVWDEPLLVNATAADAVQAMTQTIDHGGIPYVLGLADQPDFGRAVMFLAKDRAQWQWLKLFLATTFGPRGAFWLPTWRNDMTFASLGVGQVTVEVEDFRAWWPYLRQHIQLVETDGTVTYAQVTAAIDNGDGTWTLTVSDTPASSNVASISWLELCRFGGDEFELECGATGIRLQTAARAVQG